MSHKVIVPLIAASIALQTYGCQDRASSQVGGGLIGGGTGAIVGAQIGSGTGQLVAVAVGTLLGAFVGSEIGRHIHETDSTYADQAAEQAFRTGKTTKWHNPDTHHSGRINVGPKYRQKGCYCRNYTQKIYINGYEEIAHGTACRRADGTWVITN